MPALLLQHEAMSHACRHLLATQFLWRCAHSFHTGAPQPRLLDCCQVNASAAPALSCTSVPGFCAQLKMLRPWIVCSTAVLLFNASWTASQSFGSACWCQSSGAPGWQLCPALGGNTSPQPDPVQSAVDATGVSCCGRCRGLALLLPCGNAQSSVLQRVGLQGHLGGPWGMPGQASSMVSMQH